MPLSQPFGSPRRRNFFLVAALFFLDGWLFAFGLDGLLSVADQVLTAATGVSTLADIRMVVALAVLFLSPLALLLLIFGPQLPKRVFLPAVLCTVWANLIVWPFAVTANPLSGLPLSLTQLVVFAAALFVIWRRTGHWSLVPADLPVKTHLLRRTFVAFGATLALLLLALPVLLALGFAATIEAQTGGYLRFTTRGVEAAETTLAKGGKTVRLVGMIHIGEGRFYRDLFNSFPPGALVLVEGVSDRQNRLSGKFSYSGVAKGLGLEEQSGIQAEWIAKAASEKARAGAASKTHLPTIMRADIDISDFSPATIRTLTEIGEIYASPSIWAALRRSREMGGRIPDTAIAAVFAELIDKRNAKLLTTFDEQLPAHDTIIIPWGAQHMPGIEKALKERGFTIASRKTLNVAGYGALF